MSPIFGCRAYWHSALARPLTEELKLNVFVVKNLSTPAAGIGLKLLVDGQFRPKYAS